MTETAKSLSWQKWILTGVAVIFLLGPACSRAQVASVNDFDEALNQAAEKEQFIVLDISASW